MREPSTGIVSQEQSDKLVRGGTILLFIGGFPALGLLVVSLLGAPARLCFQGDFDGCFSSEMIRSILFMLGGGVLVGVVLAVLFFLIWRGAVWSGSLGYLVESLLSVFALFIAAVAFFLLFCFSFPDYVEEIFRSGPTGLPFSLYSHFLLGVILIIAACFFVVIISISASKMKLEE